MNTKPETGGRYRGQYFSFDAIIATLIFMLTMMSLLSYWYNTKSSMEYQNSEIMKEALRVSDIVFTPPFSPADSGACKVGFVDSWNYRILNYSAIKNCQSTDQNELKVKFATPYNLTLKFSIVQVSSGLGAITIGSATAVYKQDVVKVQRAAAIYDASGNVYTTVVEVYLYR